MEKHFMIDIETTGIDPAKEDLLQVGVLELDFKEGYWWPGKSLEITQHTGRQPVTAFAKKHMTALYEKCRNQPWLSPELFRENLLQFFRECGANPPDVYLMGWNASNFDIPFLMHHRVLVPSTYQQNADGTETRVGDFHYRIYELGGAVSLAQNVLGYGEDRTGLLNVAKESMTETHLPAGKEHDALYDCYAQVRLLNGLIRMMQKSGPRL
jgi:hypothetical protein